MEHRSTHGIVVPIVKKTKVQHKELDSLIAEIVAAGASVEVARGMGPAQL
jgi:hypothetical protein